VNHERKRLKRRHALTGFGFAAMVMALSVVPGAWPHPSKSPPKLVVRIRATMYGHPNGNVQFPGKITFTPDVVNVGTVIVQVRNLDDDFHTFELNGVTSRRMGGDGGKAVLRVTFKKAGTYAAGAPDDDSSGITGALKVVK
jgi:hypothetical protein